MEKTHSFLLGAAVAVVSTVVGAGAVLTAQTVAFSGTRPDAADEMEDIREIERDLDAYEALLPAPLPNTPSYARLRQVHGAAPERSAEFDLSHCEGLSGQRFTHCIVEYLENGTVYQHGQFRD